MLRCFVLSICFLSGFAFAEDLSLKGLNTASQACSVTFHAMVGDEPLHILAHRSEDLSTGQIYDERFSLQTRAEVDFGHDMSRFTPLSIYNFIWANVDAGVLAFSQTGDGDVSHPTPDRAVYTYHQMTVKTTRTGQPVVYEESLIEAYYKKVACEICDPHQNLNCKCTDGTTFEPSGEPNQTLLSESCTFNNN